MNIQILKGFFYFIILLLAQVLVLNHIHLFHCATPLLYIYVILLFPRDCRRWIVILLSFLMGTVVDVFSDTPGVSMASMTLLGLLQPLVLNLFLPRDSSDDFKPSIKTLGVTRFVYYTISMVLVYCLVFFTLETFNFFNWLLWLACIGGSAIITVVFILIIENLRAK
jgi:rod shape-determining protein MreD